MAASTRVLIERELGGRVGRAVRPGTAAAGEPGVADQPVHLVQDGFREDLALSGSTPGNDQLQWGGVAGRGSDMVEVLVQVSGGVSAGAGFVSMGEVSPIVRSGVARPGRRAAGLA